ncbi:hypothetical protein [Desulfoluna spongiiphila]|uniref:hypothetical protein n=1 Tax=Desulfoluna spongiiphila TaxID=419481 RepID=UPI000B80C9BB|nr:hypothetical protein [Desulfoluna spongiiphila]
MNKIYSSPDENYQVKFIYEWEIRFGPAYFQLELNGQIISDKLFGDKLFWSLDSKYLAVEEWLTTDSQKGPVTRLLLFDLENNKMSAFKIINKGFLRKVNFLNDRLIYIKEYAATGRGTESEVEYKNIKNWAEIRL